MRRDSRGRFVSLNAPLKLDRPTGQPIVLRGPSLRRSAFPMRRDLDGNRVTYQLQAR